MLPTEPESQLTVSPSKQPMNFVHKTLNREAMSQVASKVSTFVIENPFLDASNRIYWFAYSICHPHS